MVPTGLNWIIQHNLRNHDTHKFSMVSFHTLHVTVVLHDSRPFLSISELKFFFFFFVLMAMLIFLRVECGVRKKVGRVEFFFF